MLLLPAPLVTGVFPRETPAAIFSGDENFASTGALWPR
jgi:hypothetical protein